MRPAPARTVPGKPEEPRRSRHPKSVSLKGRGEPQNGSATPEETAQGSSLLQKAVQLCGVAYLLQLLQSTILPLCAKQRMTGLHNVKPITESLDLAALQTTMNQISSLGNLAVLLLLGWFVLSTKAELSLSNEGNEAVAKTLV